MGQPTGPELGTPDGVGRYRGYQGGAIYWSPASGAHEVHGKIYDAWAAYGWEAGLLGYPVTDELSTPDRLGRFTHFTNGSTYWTVASGAHEVSRTRCTARSGRSGRRWAGRTARWDTQSPRARRYRRASRVVPRRRGHYVGDDRHPRCLRRHRSAVPIDRRAGLPAWSASDGRDGRARWAAERVPARRHHLGPAHPGHDRRRPTALMAASCRPRLVAVPAPALDQRQARER